MEVELLQNAAAIVTFVAPGYFTIQIYSLVYAKKDRDFSHLLVESVVYSLPIVAAANSIWRLAIGHEPSSLTLGYILLLIGLAVVAGLIVVFLRTRWPLKHAARFIGLGSPDPDFLKTQLQRVDTHKSNTSAVTIRLKSGPTFSGTVDQVSRYSYNESLYVNFTNIAWYDEANNKWDERPGNIIVSRDEIEYIETSKLVDQAD